MKPLTFRHRHRTITLRFHPRAAALSPETQRDQPYYLRLRNPATGRDTWHSLRTADRALAIDRARTHLDAAAQAGDTWHRFRAATAARDTLTIAALADDWLAQGLPTPTGHPRSPDQAAAHRANLARCLPFFAAKRLAAINGPMLLEFAAWRRTIAAARRRGTGDRATDLELDTLAQLCRWAVSIGRLTSNPFADRPRFRQAAAVVHCHTAQPASDEELHALARDLFRHASPLAAAHLLLEALTGLRAHEVLLLRWDAPPGQPGHVQTMPDATQRLHVTRGKHGLNPAIPLHPALAALLAAWRPLHARLHPGQVAMIPRPGQPATAAKLLTKELAAACRRLHLPRRTSHGLRAYHVSVQRSAGLPDSQIADLLGHRSGADLIRRTYGDPTHLFGSGALDFLPTDAPPAWTLFADIP